MLKKIAAFVVLFSVVLIAQQRGTPNQIRVIVDANGALVTANAAQVAPVTSQLFSNARLAVDASGSLITVGTGGPVTGTTAAFSTSVTTPIVYGGTAANSTLTLQSTSGAGTTDQVLIKTGNNGAVQAALFGTTGLVEIGPPCVASGCTSGLPAFGWHFTPPGNINTVVDVFASQAATHSYIGRHARGTITAPLATASADNLLQLIGRGWETNTPGWSANNNAVINLQAAEAFTNAAQGTRIVFQVTPTGSTTVATAFTISGAGLQTALAGSAITVANVGANSCGTTAATVAGNQTVGEVTVGATSGTQCRVTIPNAVTNRLNGSCSNQTTANLCRLVANSTTTFDLIGTFVAGDVLAYTVMGR